MLALTQSARTHPQILLGVDNDLLRGTDVCMKARNQVFIAVVGVAIFVVLRNIPPECTLVTMLLSWSS